MIESEVPAIDPNARDTIVRLFAEKVFPHAVFQNHPRLLAWLNSKGEDREALESFWARSITEGVRAGSLPGGMTAERTFLQAMSPLMDQMVVRSYEADPYRVHGIKMPDPTDVPEAVCLAVVHRKDEAHIGGMPAPSTRFFALQMHAGDEVALVERDAEGTATNHGVCDVETLEDFATLAVQMTADEAGD